VAEGDESHRAIGFEKLNYVLQDRDFLSVALESGPV